MGSINEFLELVNALYQLGQEVPHYLLFLSELAEPGLAQELRTPILGRLFEEVPNLLSNVTAMEFHKLVANVPQDAVTFRMLVNLYKISTLFQQMSCLQILHLTNNLIPPGPLAMQAEILIAAQEHMKHWSGNYLPSPFFVIFISNALNVLSCSSVVTSHWYHSLLSFIVGICVCLKHCNDYCTLIYCSILNALCSILSLLSFHVIICCCSSLLLLRWYIMEQLCLSRLCCNERLIVLSCPIVNLFLYCITIHIIIYLWCIKHFNSRDNVWIFNCCLNVNVQWLSLLASFHHPFILLIIYCLHDCLVLIGCWSISFIFSLQYHIIIPA